MGPFNEEQKQIVSLIDRLLTLAEKALDLSGGQTTESHAKTFEYTFTLPKHVSCGPEFPLEDSPTPESSPEAPANAKVPTKPRRSASPDPYMTRERPDDHDPSDWRCAPVEALATAGLTKPLITRLRENAIETLGNLEAHLLKGGVLRLPQVGAAKARKIEGAFTKFVEANTSDGPSTENPDLAAVSSEYAAGELEDECEEEVEGP